MLQGSGLASEAAQRGFLRGAAMQDHQQQEAAAASMGIKNSFPRIRDVWKSNLDQEMAVLRQLIPKYPYVSMDAEFPGIVARPIGNFAGSKAEYHYQTLRCNVDILKPIQVGITLWSANGELPPQQPDPALIAELTGGRKVRLLDHNGFLPCTWVFNFHFDLEADMYAESSIDLLKTSGVDFQKHQEFGIDINAFGSLITTSGLAFSEDTNWLSFHSGYDFGYLIKLLTNDALPPDQNQFFELVSTFFPKLWDIKFLLRDAQRRKLVGRMGVEGARILEGLGSKSGLQDLADELGCERVGRPHTGGSDAWLTGSVFWAMRSKIFAGNLEPELADQIYGLHGVQMPASQQFREEFFAAQGTPQQQQANGALSNALQGGAVGFTSNNPSTPTTSHVGLSGGQTPGQGYGNHGLGGGSLGQGGFGNFSYGK
ncbi:ribonuclease H-like protein [Teratosphaeria nubilosa]|uniref:poly(A)-specific ribonuclease n=1 Tax=Teratosphaeria nubilosa TaxID=161662 RepID=A0A6G1L6G3_9PEZI|nr:ribonuclease H-like protein [Teratosphaeria nubilosa]